MLVKWRLKPGPGSGVEVEDELLDRLLDRFVTELVIPHERGHPGIEVGNGLSPCRFALKGIEEVDDLTQSGSKVPGRTTFNLAGNSSKTLPEKIQ